MGCPKVMKPGCEQLSRACRRVPVWVMHDGEFSNCNGGKRLAGGMDEIFVIQKAGKCPWGEPQRPSGEYSVG